MAGTNTAHVAETSRSVQERLGEHVGDMQEDLEGIQMSQHLKTTHTYDWQEQLQGKTNRKHYEEAASRGRGNHHGVGGGGQQNRGVH